MAFRAMDRWSALSLELRELEGFVRDARRSLEKGTWHAGAWLATPAATRVRLTREIDISNFRILEIRGEMKRAEAEIDADAEAMRETARMLQHVG
jgi:hypothetical protein